MSATAARRLLALLGVCLTLIACSRHNARESDSALGLDAQNSPGDLYVAMAAEYYRLGQLDEAMRRAQQAIAEDNRNPRAYYMIGVIYQRIGQMPQAEASFKQAVEISPNNPDIRNAYGNFFCEQRRFSEAQAQFAKALENPLYNTPWVAMVNAGICAASAGDRTRAQTEYRRALKANPRFGPALLKLAELEYGRGDAKAAKDSLDRFFQANAPTPQALELAIATERKLGNSKGAATYEQMLRKSFPGAAATQDR